MPSVLPAQSALVLRVEWLVGVQQLEPMLCTYLVTRKRSIKWDMSIWRRWRVGQRIRLQIRG